MGRRLAGLVVAAVVCGSLLFASSASAYITSTAAFTKANATPDWTKTSFAGSINWNYCNTGCKSWLVLVFAEPTVYKCEAEDWLVSGDPNIRQVWNSLGQSGNKTLPFEQNEVGLIPGVLGQRLCVIGIQTTYSALYEQDIIENQVIGQTLLTVVTPPAPPPAPAIEETKPTLSKTCQKARQKVNRLTAQRNAARKTGATKSIHRLNQALREARKQQKANC
jgi:hypothetical protein